MKKICRILSLVLSSAICSACWAGVDLDAAPGKLGWTLGTQAWTFHKLTFLETLERAQKLGLKVVEFYPSQKFSAEEAFNLDWKMSAEQRTKVLKAAADAGIELASFGVVTAKSDQWPAIIQLAQDMKVENVTLEPEEKDIPAIDKLAKAANVRLAIHDHPKPSHYWNPDILLAAVKGQSDLWGSCADTGHWVRSGLDPIECLQKLKGRIIESHFKDLNEAGPKAHDVPWGTGVNNVWAELTELKAQGFKGNVFVEYEHDTPELMDNVAKSLEFFKLASAGLGEDAWEPLLKEDLSNAQMEEGGWKYENGVLTSLGKGDLWTKEQYGDCIVDLEFRCDAPDTNSGVFLRCSSIKDWLNTAIEVQILQTDETETKHNTGGIYDIKGPTEHRFKPQGEWNHYTIIARRNMIYVMLNGGQVLNIDLDQWKEAGKNPDGTPNKFKNAYAAMARKGFIGLQYHGHPVSFRNLRIKSIDK